MSESSTEDLKKRETILKAVMYVAGGLLLINIGYNIALLVFQKIDSLSEIVGRSIFSLGGFAASLFLSTCALKKTRAEISSRESQGSQN